MNEANYFVQNILPGFALLKKVVVPTTSSAEILKKNVENPVHITSAKSFPFEDKRFLVLLESNQVNHGIGISEESRFLLKKILSAMQLQEDEYFISHDTASDLSMTDLLSFLTKARYTQVIFLIGATMTQQILDNSLKISQAQGQIFEKNVGEKKFFFIPLYHPEFIALNQSIKSLTWASVQKLIPWIGQLKSDGH